MLQSLLPTFGPRTLNSMLVVKQAFDATPGASDILDKMFSLPMGLFMKVFSINVSAFIAKGSFKPCDN